MTPAEKSATWRAANPERMREHQAKYRATHRVELREYDRRYYEKNSRRWKERHRLRAYGLTPEAFEKLVEAQRSLCALCAKELPQNRTFIAVDHDHDTGRVRGLLHRGCNVAVGAYENRREQIAAYLKLYGEN